MLARQAIAQNRRETDKRVARTESGIGNRAGFFYSAISTSSASGLIVLFPTPVMTPSSASWLDTLNTVSPPSADGGLSLPLSLEPDELQVRTLRP
jgi:hypothetical protein